jgi:pimeloyl-ACP methyl ester carboxylesterase
MDFQKVSLAMAHWWSSNNSGAAVPFDRSVLGDDPDAYLAASEARIPAIRPGLQKQIIWANPATKTKTPCSVIYIHGFSASLGELRPLPDLVAVRLKANLFYTRLTGHGEAADSLGRATIGDWLADMAEAIAIGERIGDKVIVMATSTGGALATWALAQPGLSGRIAAAIFFSPNYGLQARGGFLLSAPFARQIVHAVVGRTRGFEPSNDLHAKFWTTRYSTDALLPMAASIVLANRAPLQAIKVPALFLYSPRDRTVDPNRIIRNAGRWGGPHRLIAVDTEDPSGHVLAGNALSPGTTQAMARQIGEWLDICLA